MLRIASLQDRTGRYYLAPGPADLPAGTEVAFWAGRASASLGFAGPVGARGLQALLEGRAPEATRPLGRFARRVSGYDLMFAAPKSVSVLAALGPSEVARAVVGAHRRAVGDAIGYLEGRVLTVQAGRGEERSILATDGAVAAVFLHGTSRSLDPHLHAHVVLANLAHGADGRWRALDGRSLYAHRWATGELYRCALRAELTRVCGLEWAGRRNGSWEVEGVDPLLLGAFSGRAAEQRQEAFERGRPGSPGALGRGSGRPAKAVLAREVLEEHWRSTAARVGVDYGDLSRSLTGGPPGPRRGPPTLDEHRFAAAVHRLGDRSVLRRSTVAAWAGALAQGSSAAEIDRCVDELAPWGEGRGVSERPRAPAEVVPAPHLLRALGPRPVTWAGLVLWRDGAAALADYRRRWGIAEREPLLGPEARDAARDAGSLRLAEHLALSRRLEELARRLGRSAGRAMAEPSLGRER